jgi:16S rRNA (uracil1498-N3)-methyltransferase
LNLILLESEDFTAPDRVVLRGRRRDHIVSVHRASVGDTLVVGRLHGRIGRGTIETMDGEGIVMTIELDREPPRPLDIRLVLALPRPKVLNRVIASTTSMGVKRIALINAWRVEKSYWSSPRLLVDNLRAQCVTGLEQARDTILPEITQHRFFRSFVENELEGLAGSSMRLVAHPGATTECPRAIQGPVTMVIGPEGGFIAEEVASLQLARFQPVTLGERVLRVETAVAALLARVAP